MIETEKENILNILKSEDFEKISETVIGIAFYESDFDFAFSVIVQCAVHSNELVRGNAILCLGHLARIHGQIPIHPTVELISQGLKDLSEYVRGQSLSAFDDLRMFTPEIGKLISC